MQRENRWQFAARTSVAMRLFEPYAAPFVFLQRNAMANDMTRAAGDLLHRWCQRLGNLEIFNVFL